MDLTPYSLNDFIADKKGTSIGEEGRGRERERDKKGGETKKAMVLSKILVREMLSLCFGLHELLLVVLL